VPLFAEASTWSVLLNIVVLLLSVLLMFIVLIQRGKGGGLAGAFGGVGGSSPFGSRAGDTFTRITLYMALVWVLVIMIHVKVAQHDGKSSTAPQAIRSPQ
jgi:preprotein translocase subunit SecG